MPKRKTQPVTEPIRRPPGVVAHELARLERELVNANVDRANIALAGGNTASLDSRIRTLPAEIQTLRTELTETE